MLRVDDDVNVDRDLNRPAENNRHRQEDLDIYLTVALAVEGRHLNVLIHCCTRNLTDEFSNSTLVVLPVHAYVPFRGALGLRFLFVPLLASVREGGIGSFEHVDRKLVNWKVLDGA